MLINFVDATNDANHYTKLPPLLYVELERRGCSRKILWDGLKVNMKSCRRMNGFRSDGKETDGVADKPKFI